jgi:polyisoprenoid-binding protein YceI
MRPLATFAVAAVLLPAAALMLSEGLARGALAPAAPALEARLAGDPKSGTFEIDPVHSSMLFNVVHAEASRFWGRFDSFKGQLVVDAAKPDAGSVVVEVAAESVDTGNKDRDNHLRGPDFFNAKEFPDIVFESKKVEKAPKGFKVSGEFTMLGVTKPVTADAEFIGYSEGERTGKRTGYEVRFTIKRSDFGMKYGLGPGGVSDEVNVLFSLSAVAK